MDLAFVGVAAAVQLSESGEICSASIALGAVAPTPMRAFRAEARLAGCLPDEGPDKRSQSSGFSRIAPH